MKVVYYINSLSQGGAERVMLKLAKYTSTAEDRSLIITNTASESDFYQSDERVRRRSLGHAAARPVQRATSEVGVLRKVGRALGLSVALSAWKNVGRIMQLRRVLREERPDVLVTMLPVPNIVGILAARSLKVSVIACERNYPPARPLPWHWAFARRLVYRHASAHVAQTDQIADWLSSQTGARNVHVIPNPISLPLELHDPLVRPADLVPDERGLILAVGSKCWQKGFDRLPDIFAPLAAEYPEWDIAIVGMTPIFPEDADAEKQLHRQLQEHGLNDRVHFVPKAGNIADWYRRAEIFVLTSRFEGFPNVLLEAMAHGLPSVSFDCPTGPGDMIMDNENGRIVADGDIDAFSGALGHLIASPEERARLGVAAENVRVTNSETAILAQWRAVIDTCSTRKSRSAA